MSVAEWIRDLPDEEYHKRKELSSTGIRDFMECPKYYYEKYHLGKHVKKRTKALLDGARLHAAILERKLEDLSDEDLDIADAIISDPEFQYYFSDGHAEISGFGTLNGVDCRIRCDYLVPGNNLILDLKTTASLSMKSINYSIEDYGYHYQAAFYSMLAEEITGNKHGFLFCFMEKKAPYRVQILELSRNYLSTAQNAVLGYLDVFRGCLKNNDWPKHKNEFQVVKHWSERG